MTEAVFPLLGTIFVVLVVLPSCALLAKLGLLLLECDEAGGPLHGLNRRFFLLTASSAMPLSWFLSAGLHQAESGKSVLACMFEHEAGLCFEPGYFALTLLMVAVALSAPALRDQLYRSNYGKSTDGTLARRVQQIFVLHPELRSLRGRIRFTDEPGFALATRGIVRPLVLIGSRFAAQLSDEMLASALGHELEHLRSLDPLRFLVLRIALAVNPFGRFLLEPHAKRWRAAREAHCDREAVIHGSAPLPLADAIVRAARPSPREVVALGARDTAVLKFRVEMLFAFAERRPERCCRQGSSTFILAIGMLMLALLLPHQAGTAALDALHTGAEYSLTYFWR